MKAYVLVSIHTGEVTEVVRHLRRIDSVVEANMTFGPYDAVVIISTENIKTLGKILAQEIQPIPGVLETLTCLAVEI